MITTTCLIGVVVAPAGWWVGAAAAVVTAVAAARRPTAEAMLVCLSSLLCTNGSLRFFAEPRGKHDERTRRRSRPTMNTSRAIGNEDKALPGFRKVGLFAAFCSSHRGRQPYRTRPGSDS